MEERHHQLVGSVLVIVSFLFTYGCSIQTHIQAQLLLCKIIFCTAATGIIIWLFELKAHFSLFLLFFFLLIHQVGRDKIFCQFNFYKISFLIVPNERFFQNYLKWLNNYWLTDTDTMIETDWCNDASFTHRQWENNLKKTLI